MTETRKTYSEILKSVAGKDWKDNKDWSIGHAGAAIASSVLTDGKLELKHLTKECPDFSQTELRTALMNLKKSKFFVKDEGLYKLSIDEDTEITSEVFWALLINVAQGYIQRANDKYKEK